ncbi:TCR/Tet family MFS transporter [Sphingobium sufflavum]|uniref:TCR/Tet family MFS transporter n=1 Tax=Sphingobium sufflavum TaxID=1129547 RepID=UPI001F28021C|nr:TCR/Tet family MFS transporter [Sphingobium sufflavum]MCE7795138.1 TCR/Tet family MFS transporter [Sphingobium sufflavum]
MTGTAIRRRTAAIGFILVAAVLDVLSMSIIIPVLPDLIREMAGSSARAGAWNGVFVALWAVMQFVCAPVIGALSDRFGRRPVLLISIAGLGLDYVLMALAPNLWWLAAGRLIGGITASSFTTVFAYMADITAPEQRARGYGLIGAAFSGGFIVGPVIGGALGEISARAPFWVAAGLSGAAFLYGLLLLPESLAPASRMAFAWKRANPLGSLALLRSRGSLFGLSIVNFLMQFAKQAFMVVFVLYVGDRYGWTPWETGLLLGLTGILDMVVQAFLIGPVVRRWGDRRALVAGLSSGGIALIGNGVAPTGEMFIASCLLSALWGLAMPSLQALMTRQVSDSEQGQLQGANTSVASIAGVISPLTFGAVYALSAGPGAAIPFPGAAFVLAGVIVTAAAALAALVAPADPKAARSAA